MADGGLPRAQEAEREEMARIREEKKAHEERQYLAFEQVSYKLNFHRRTVYIYPSHSHE